MTPKYTPLKERTPEAESYWNHAFDLAFSVISRHQDWGDTLEDPAEKEVIKAELMRRVETLFGPDNEYREALSAFDTYESHARPLSGK